MIVPVFQGNRSRSESDRNQYHVSRHFLPHTAACRTACCGFSGVFEPADIIGIQAVFQMPSGGLQTPLAQIFLSFLMDCVVMKQRPPKLLNFRLRSEDSPASVQTINFESEKSLRICSSNGIRVVCSLVLPGWIQKARGIPLRSMKSPISTIGLGRCSLLGPYCFRPS